MTTIYFPIAGNGTPDPDATCFGNDKALAFYRLLVSDPRQQRPRLVCCPALVLAAQRRAHGLANGDPWGHVDAAGVWANTYARNAGCVLPSDYGNGNNIESLTAGTGDVQAAFDSLTNDNAPKHRAHLLGESEFYRRQTMVGIGYAEGGQYGFYWSILIGICGVSSGE